MLWEVPTSLPRHAFSLRDAARAGDVWRAMQEVAIEGSARAGWHPMRYRETGSAFVMRSMTVVHDREALYGEALTARTWIRRFRRATFCTREIAIASERGDIARGTQEWVHVRATDEDGSLSLRAARAPEAMIEAFPPTEVEGYALPALPAADDQALAPLPRFEFEVWHTWMDPLDHVNHPAYVDFADEALARWVASVGLRPVDLVPVAETVTYRAGIGAGVRAWVETHPRAYVDGALHCEHRVGTGETLCATVTTVRRHPDLAAHVLRSPAGGEA